MIYTTFPLLVNLYFISKCRFHICSLYNALTNSNSHTISNFDLETDVLFCASKFHINLFVFINETGWITINVVLAIDVKWPEKFCEYNINYFFSQNEWFKNSLKACMIASWGSKFPSWKKIFPRWFVRQRSHFTCLESGELKEMKYY